MVQIDMEMPQDCDHCYFGYEDYITKKSGCDLMDCLPNSPDCSAYTPIGQRDKNCPLRKVPKGKWIIDVAYYDECGCPCIVTICDQCGTVHPVSNFCPNCGADMREE